MELSFQEILNSVTCPIFVARPIYDDHELLIDCEICYMNSQMKKLTDHIFKNEKFISKIEQNFLKELPWKDIINSVLNSKLIPSNNFYSPATKSWYRIEYQVGPQNYITGTLINSTSEQNYYQKLKESIITDSLTGLYNRAGFADNFEIKLEDARYNKKMTGLLIIDIDNLKNINDALGQKKGDSMIVKVSEALQQFIHDNITVYRYGDDEFAVIISDLESKKDIKKITNNIYEYFRSKRIEVSGGISIFPLHSESGEELIRFADMAVHYAKKNGKNNFSYFEKEMQNVFLQHLTLQTKMTAAVIDCSFRQFYQPQFDIRTGNLRGFEALIRWHDNELGDISPSVFIPLAEETGLIIPIGHWVLETAISTLKIWQDNFNFNGIMSVNVSPIQMRQECFIDEIKFLINEYKVNPTLLEIEITEGVMINNIENTISLLEQIKDLGIRVSLDDFGTGYSSLSYLQELPLNTLKIDKSFINNITSKDGVQANITRSIIQMVERMGLETIAEGVENPEQLDLLNKFNCNVIQGFLRGRPVPKEQCEAFFNGDKNALLKL